MYVYMILYKYCLCMFMPYIICMYTSIDVRACVCVRVCLSVWLSGCLAVWLSVWLSGCLAVWLAGCLSVCLPAVCHVCKKQPRDRLLVDFSRFLWFFDMIRYGFDTVVIQL